MKLSTPSTIVFLGPTLSIQEAKDIFPEACYHAPAKCGDLLRVLRLKPKQIVLIDGLFENVPSIWHKEILFALEKGVVVYGASSMGALRAAELADCGMIGVGKIFRDFYTGAIDNDDAVAVLHSDQKYGYAPLNHALVDFQASLEDAYLQKKITADQKEAIFQEMTYWFYPERTLEKLGQQAAKNPPLFHSFFARIQKDGMNEQKREDAIEALRLARGEDRGGSIPNITQKFPKTIYIRNLMKEINLSLFPEAYGWLPPEEKSLIELKKNDPNSFNGLTQAGFLLSICSDLAYTERGSQKGSLDEIGWNWAHSKAIDPIEKRKWSKAFNEIFFSESIADLCALFFLAAESFECEFPLFPLSPPTHSFLSRIQLKDQEMQRRITQFYLLHQAPLKPYLNILPFTSINWIEKVFILSKKMTKYTIQLRGTFRETISERCD